MIHSLENKKQNEMERNCLRQDGSSFSQYHCQHGVYQQTVRNKGEKEFILMIDSYYGLTKIAVELIADDIALIFFNELIQEKEYPHFRNNLPFNSVQPIKYKHPLTIYFYMSKKHQISALIDQLTKNEKFLSQVQKYVEGISKPAQDRQQLPTFAFQKAGKYPWSIIEGSLPVQGQKMIEEITDLIGNIIDNNLHQILSRQFLNISNEILIIRDEMTQFTKEEEMRVNKMKEEFTQQVEHLKKRMVVQQNMGSGQKEFVRTRATGMLNSSLSSSTKLSSDGLQFRAELDSMKKDIQLLRRDVNKGQIVHTINDKLIYIEDKLKHEMTDFKIKIESVKQKSQKNYHQLVGKISENSNKQFIGSEVKRAVKSHFKIYLQQIGQCKSSIVKFQDSLSRLDKGLQEYVANQLKSLWVVVGNMKRRVESIQQSTNLNNQSFMME